ncbi:MAG: 2-C-methyl-D-erythritol 4-phosphate cytidylyltransferase [Chloroflexi bacterium]|nr:MAG: 2-C-methyl-D-erythritol 4-phosphate cytidylyltransferase [Chloroflexota bacterium]
MQNTSAAIIVAAGASRRMQGRDKLWTPLAGRIILARTIDVFEASPLIESIVLVPSTERLADISILCNNEGWHKIAAIVPGGARRQDSVCAGLDALAAVTPTPQWVTIHDAARPLVTSAILEAGLKAAQEYQAAIAAVPVKDTIKLVQEGRVTATLDRSQLWAIQTPQVFSFLLIHQAHHSPAAMGDVTDDATLIEQLGHPVVIFPGAYTNIKITTEEDLFLAEALIQGYKT